MNNAPTALPDDQPKPLETPVAKYANRFADDPSKVPVFQVTVDAPLSEAGPLVTSILLQTTIEKVAEQFCAYWNAGWFTTGKPVVAVSGLQLTITDTAAIVGVQIGGGAMKPIAVRRFIDKGVSLIGPREMAIGQRVH